MILRAFGEGGNQLCVGITQGAVARETLPIQMLKRSGLHLFLTSSSPQALAGSSPNTSAEIFLDRFSAALLARSNSLVEYSLSSAILF